MIRMRKIFAVLICIAMVICCLPIVKTHANEYDTKGYERDEKLVKKLAKNSISWYPNEKSKPLTYGYALKQIKAYVEKDSNAFYGSHTNWVNEYESWGNGIKISFKGTTKTARKAMKWGVSKGLVHRDIDVEKGWYATDDVPQTLYDADKVLTRWDLVDLMSRVMNSYYGGRIPMLLSFNYRGYPFHGSRWQDALYDFSSINSCIFFEALYGEGFYDFVHLEERATREDFSRCMKNLKLIVESKWTAKIINRDNPIKSYGQKEWTADFEEIKAFLKEENLNYKIIWNDESGIKFEIKTVFRVDDKNLNDAAFILGKNYFKYYSSLYEANTAEVNYDARKVSVTETFKEFIKKRG